MTSVRRIPFFARVAGRYALRHRGQTVRAVLGLLVVTTVLVTGLGLGESIATSLERVALARFGPIDVAVTSPEPFDADVADRALRDPAVRAFGADGAATLSVTGAASHPARDLAEAFATIRGVSAGERRALGPLAAPDGSVVPEPGRGEVVLSRSLADRLEARPGDRVVLRAPIPGRIPDPALELQNVTGVAGLPPPAEPTHVVEVREGALGAGAFVQWAEAAGPLRIEARSPSGATFSNESATSPVVLLLFPPLEEGPWTFIVGAARPTPYLGTTGVAYPPPSLASGLVVMNARVSGIAADEGRAGITLRPTAIVPLEDFQDATGMKDRANRIYFRVSTDPYAAARAINDVLPNASGEFETHAVKAEAITRAREAGRDITGFLLVMGGFTLLAAMLLAFALFSALVEERRAELGIARALGLTRGEVAFTMTLEGALYAGAAALVGLALGIGLLAAAMYGIGAASESRGGPEIGLHLSNGTLRIAFLVGTLIPLGTIGLASLRFARLDPARAIRGIPEDPKGGRRFGLGIGVGLLALGALLSIGTIGRLLGIPLAAAGLSLVLSSLGRRALALVPAVLGVAHVAWSLYSFTAWPADRGEIDPIVTMTRGALLALGLSALAVASPRPYAFLARLAGRGDRGQRSGFVALRYLVSRRRVAGLTMGMIALVVVVVTVMGTLFLLFSGRIPQEEAGYAVLGESPLLLDAYPEPLPADLASDVERTDFLVRHFEFRRANLTRNGEPVGPEWGLRTFIGIPPSFAEHNRYELAQRAQQYPDDRSAWDAVARGEALLVPSWLIDEDGLATGDRVTLRTALGTENDYVIAGAARSNEAAGIFLSTERVKAMGFPTGTLIFVRTVPGADPDAIAHRLTSVYSEQGVSFVSIPEEAAAAAAAVQAFILVFESFLALGLFVGLAATGFLASRAVHERARDIGTLRALGYEEKDVRRVFILESTVTAAVGLAAGAGVGVLVAHSIWWREIRSEGIPFTPPLWVLFAFAAAVLALSALAARGPAKRAAALPPALAVRHVE